MKLNIGSGDVKIDGFEPVDRKHGKEAYPLEYADNSVDEIRASHILEHFPQARVHDVLADWARVLKPGGRIRIAVPDFDKIASDPAIQKDPLRFAYLMGGHVDENDVHHAAFTQDTLRQYMQQAGIEDIQPWTSENTDCASLPVSLNLEGVKGVGQKIRMRAVMSVPRYGSLAARGIIETALKPFQIPLDTSQGVYWGQKMQRHFEDAIRDELDWLLTIDYDSVFTADMLDQLMGRFGQSPDIDALCALEVRRDGDRPLLTQGDTSHEIEVDGSPILVTTAHFGLTLFRMECLKEVEKPWFKAEPEPDGTWGDERLDDDIWFWHQWRLARRNIYCDPLVRIGHVEESVAYYDETMEVQRCGVPAWRDTFMANKREEPCS